MKPTVVQSEYLANANLFPTECVLCKHLLMMMIELVSSVTRVIFAAILNVSRVVYLYHGYQLLSRYTVIDLDNTSRKAPSANLYCSKLIYSSLIVIRCFACWIPPLHAISTILLFWLCCFVCFHFPILTYEEHYRSICVLVWYVGART